MLVYRDGLLTQIAQYGRDATKWPEIERYAAWLED